MQAKVIYYWDGDPPAVRFDSGYICSRIMKNGFRYKFGIIRRREDPTYSVVDIYTGYRYPTNARTIHEAARFAGSVDLTKQPTKGDIWLKRRVIIQGYYDGIPWGKEYCDTDDPKGLNFENPDWVEGRKDYGDDDSKHD